jgi:hypothetical protein
MVVNAMTRQSANPGKRLVTLPPHLAFLGLLALAACASPVPDSGVGFGDYATYQAEREAALIGAAPVRNTAPVGALPAPAPIASAPIASAPLPPGGIPPTDLAAAGIGSAPLGTAPLGTTPLGTTSLGAPLSATAPAGVAGPDPYRMAGVQASPANALPPVASGSPGISDEQDFSAVSTRQSIESDAARRAQQAAQYQVVQPTSLPTPPANTGPNIVAYALAAPNRVGQPWYSRFVFAGSRYNRNCGAYRSADEAQQQFLARGGPERDPLGIDPDGDGFACAWDPAPFLAAVGRS